MKAILLAALGLCASAATAAALQCGPTEQVLVGLSERYQEEAVASGLMSDGNVALVTARADGVTWTLLMVRPDGQSCLISAGTNWEPASPAPAGQEG